MVCFSQKANKPATDLWWSSLWKYNVRKPFPIDKVWWWWMMMNLDDEGIVELAASVCYYFQFPWQNWKQGGWQRPRGLKHFSYWYLLFFRCEEYNLLLFLLRKGCFLIDSFVFWRFYKVLFESKCYSKCYFEIWNLFSQQFWFKKLHFQPPT